MRRLTAKASMSSQVAAVTWGGQWVRLDPTSQQLCRCYTNSRPGVSYASCTPFWSTLTTEQRRVSRSSRYLAPMRFKSHTTTTVGQMLQISARKLFLPPRALLGFDVGAPLGENTTSGEIKLGWRGLFGHDGSRCDVFRRCDCQ